MSDLKVREFPLVCTAASVRALLAGEKTQHREPVSDHNTVGIFKASSLDLTKAWVDPGPSTMGNPGPYLKASPLPRGPEYNDDVVHRLYPRVQVGDRLWVREAWALYESEKHNPFPDLPSRRGPGGLVFYREGFDRSPLSWRPARHLPRWASRLTLEVTEIRVHRLQELSEEDAIAEGVFDAKEHDGSLPSETFRHVWDTAHYQRGDGWDANPWVWVYTLARVEVGE